MDVRRDTIRCRGSSHQHERPRVIACRHPGPASRLGRPSRAGVVPLVEVRDLVKHFPVKGGILQRTVGQVKAVDGVSFDHPARRDARPGRRVGLRQDDRRPAAAAADRADVGRRSCSTAGGQVDIAKLDGARAQAVPAADADHLPGPVRVARPAHADRSSIAEGLRIHDASAGATGAGATRCCRMMDMVGLASYHARRYPHEFSGGQRQRIGIARALVLEPDLVVCDEPVSALDVSIQAQVLNLLKNLQRELGLTYLFIAHNMGVVEHISDRVAVMYLGRIAELADRRMMFTEPLHPVHAGPVLRDPRAGPELRRKRIILEGDVPSPLNPPSGCRFNPRCQLRAQLGGPSLCVEREPALVEVQAGQSVACHFRGPSATANLDAIQSASESRRTCAFVGLDLRRGSRWAAASSGGRGGDRRVEPCPRRVRCGRARSGG